MKNLLNSIARATSILLHPMIIPTLGFLLLFNSDFYFALLPWNVKKILLFVVFVSTCFLPAVSIGVLLLNPKFDVGMGKSTDRILPMIFSSIFYYFGYLVLSRIPVYPVYGLFLLAGILIQVSLILISFRWKISAHSAAIGALVGGTIGLSYRLEGNPVLILILVILMAGLVGTARLILQKHTIWQVITGFFLGFLVMDLMIAFV